MQDCDALRIIGRGCLANKIVEPVPVLGSDTGLIRNCARSPGLKTGSAADFSGSEHVSSRSPPVQ
jgi:hypothetical protein